LDSSPDHNPFVIPGLERLASGCQNDVIGQVVLEQFLARRQWQRHFVSPKVTQE
jgi:hypothetical protein